MKNAVASATFRLYNVTYSIEQLCFKTIMQRITRKRPRNTRYHSMKLYYPDSRVLARQNVYSVRVVQVWNNLPNEVVSATCVSVFKSLLNSIDVSF